MLLKDGLGVGVVAVTSGGAIGAREEALFLVSFLKVGVKLLAEGRVKSVLENIGIKIFEGERLKIKKAYEVKNDCPQPSVRHLNFCTP